MDAAALPQALAQPPTAAKTSGALLPCCAVLQGSDNLDHWRVNLTFDPVPFEDPALGIKVGPRTPLLTQHALALQQAGRYLPSLARCPSAGCSSLGPAS